MEYWVISDITLLRHNYKHTIQQILCLDPPLIVTYSRDIFNYFLLPASFLISKHCNSRGIKDIFNKTRGKSFLDWCIFFNVSIGSHHSSVLFIVCILVFLCVIQIMVYQKKKKRQYMILCFFYYNVKVGLDRIGMENSNFIVLKAFFQEQKA